MDQFLFMLFGVPLACLVVGGFVFFGTQNGTLKMTRPQVIALEAVLLVVALASGWLAVEIMQRR